MSLVRFFIVHLIFSLAIVSMCFASTGTIKWFIKSKGLACIIPDDGSSNVYLYYPVRTETYDVGDHVNYGVGTTIRKIDIPI